MTTVTIEQIQAKQSELASMIAQLLAAPTVVPTTIQIEEETIELAPGEHYAGAVLDANGEHMHHLVLMAARPDADVTWKDAEIAALRDFVEHVRRNGSTHLANMAVAVLAARKGEAC